MNEIHVAVSIRNVETKEELRPLGEAVHALTDPGDDVQAIHGWRRYMAARLGDAVTATVVSELLREDVAQSVPVVSRAELEQAAAELAAEDGAPPPSVVRDLLLLVAEEIPREDFPLLEEIEGWDEYVRAEVAAWAGAHHLVAGDHEGVTIPPVPAVLAGESDAETEDDADGEAPAGGEASATPGGGEAGAPDADAGEAVPPDGGGAEAGDPPADPGASGEAHAGSEGAASSGKGDGAVSRARGRRRGSSEEAAAEARRRDGAIE